MSSFILPTLQALATEYPWLPQFVLMSSIALVFYFFMLRPQQRHQREQKKFLESMKKGTQVVTIGGLYGKIHEVTSETVTLTIDHKGSKVTILKGAISLDSTKQYASHK